MNKLFKIVKDNKKSIRVPSDDIAYPIEEKYLTLGKEMLEYLKFSQTEEASKYKVRSGVGLAAPQIGINKKLIAVYFEDYDQNTKKEKIVQYVLINPKITLTSVKLCALKGGEGCLSVDKPHDGIIHRPYKITVKAFSVLDNKDIEFVAMGYEAIVLQHEIDHLSGILFYDRIDPLNPLKVKEGTILY